MEGNCRPRALLPNLSRETFLLPDGFFSPSYSHKSDSFLYQILVLTATMPEMLLVIESKEGKFG
jgi:hypothetical protein